MSMLTESQLPVWKNDQELFSIARCELFSSLLGDVLDKLGYHNQFLPAQIKPLSSEMVVIGRAMPVLEEDLGNGDANGSPVAEFSKPFGVMLEALDDLRQDEVYICSGASPAFALWGGLMSIRAMKLGAAGAVLNGYWRDTKEVRRLNFPTFGMGSYGQDQEPRGRVVGYRTPIEVNGVKVNPGDIVFGDLDGVVIVPQELEQPVFSGAIEKARGEKVVKKALEDGMTSAEAFRRFGLM